MIRSEVKRIQGTGNPGLLWCLAFLTFAFGCDSADPPDAVPPAAAPSAKTDQGPPPKFDDLFKSNGVRFIPTNGEEENHYAILETLGSGGGFTDFDLDGLPDCIIAGGGWYNDVPAPVGKPLALIRNLEDVSEFALVSQPGFYNHGVIIADVDNDGFDDFLLTGFRGLVLYRNNGDGTFADETPVELSQSASWSTGAAWGDLNSDGNLDLYLVNYVNWSFENNPKCYRNDEVDVCAPGQFTELSDRFFVSNADGTFAIRTDNVGLVDGGKGLGVLAADFDVDGDIDFYVANDTTANFLYINEDGVLNESGFISGTAVDDTATMNGSMGIDATDINGDGLLDIWVANYEDENFAMYQNLGNAIFQHRSRRLGISSVGSIYVGFGTSFLDFDLDGDQDIAVTNGHVMRHAVNSPLRQKPILFERKHDGTFENIAPNISGYFSEDHVGRGLATADINADGLPDLLVTHVNEPVSLLVNSSKNENRWIKIKLVGEESNRDAVGVGMTVTTGDLSQYTQITSGESYLSSNSKIEAFGVGNATEVNLKVSWPNRQPTEFVNLETNRCYSITESGRLLDVTLRE